MQYRPPDEILAFYFIPSILISTPFSLFTRLTTLMGMIFPRVMIQWVADLPFMQFLGWDQAARNHVSEYPANFTGNQIIAHEFPYNKTNNLIYDANGVQIYSNIAFHYDTPGPVSLRLNWNGLSFTYSGENLNYTKFWFDQQVSDLKHMVLMYNCTLYLLKAEH